MGGGQTRSKRRVADYGEVFTARREVEAMIDLVKQEAERVDSRFLEPACGNGNFLAPILRRKLQTAKARCRKDAGEFERYAVLAVTSIYGVDLLWDNVAECRDRLFGIFEEECGKAGAAPDEGTRAAVRHILARNILCGDALTMEAGDGRPIVFAEWSPMNGAMLKRRDFRFDQILKDNNGFVSQSLFDEGPAYAKQGDGAWAPEPIREFPPVHYREVVRHA
jgi:SAM-dependent methyltransferase